MPEGRPAIPAELKRAVLVEAGHRCAIPTCRAETTEIAHIVPWEKVKEHTFDNLIALCPTCHTRYDVGQDIDRKAMLQYKANLGLLTSRYGDLERRFLEALAAEPSSSGVILPGGMTLMMKHLLDDGMVVIGENSGGSMGIAGVMVPAFQTYVVTAKGHRLVQRWVDASPIE